MTEDIGQLIYEAVAAGATYAEAGGRYGLSMGAARGRARRYYDKNGLEPPGMVSQYTISGAMQDEPHAAPEELWHRALSNQERNEQRLKWKQERRVIYNAGPVVIIFMADLHLGNPGTNIRGIDMDINTVTTLSEAGVNLGVVILGDLLDNFIVGRLRDLRLNQSPFLAIEEWGLVDYVLERLSPYLIGSVAGNHDNWSWALVGVDLLRERHRTITPGILYDPVELAFVLQVGDYEARLMCRHDWRGHSMYSPTYGIEHGHHTRGRSFNVGVGAHTHRGGLAREFANGTATPAHALVCGTYKKDDAYAQVKGYPPPLDTSAVAIVVDEDGIGFSTSRLDKLIDYLT